MQQKKKMAFKELSIIDLYLGYHETNLFHLGRLGDFTMALADKYSVVIPLHESTFEIVEYSSTRYSNE